MEPSLQNLVIFCLATSFFACSNKNHESKPKQSIEGQKLKLDKFDTRWIGNYFLEISNKDELVTSFLISINPNSIDLEYVSDSEKKKIYRNVEANFLSSETIEIVFNEKNDEMVTVLLERNEGSYFLSGNPVAMINPGNDSFEVKRLDSTTTANTR